MNKPFNLTSSTNISNNIISDNLKDLNFDYIANIPTSREFRQKSQSINKDEVESTDPKHKRSLTPLSPHSCSNKIVNDLHSYKHSNTKELVL